MAIYSFLAPLLGTWFFKDTATWKAFLFSYGMVFIASCLFYPIGAIYYGYIGDKQGRQKTCIYSTLGLAAATGLMGCIPYHIFLEYTWVLFLILICAQHFFSGGEYHGSIVFSLEHAREHKIGLMSSMSCLFAVFGLVGASVLTLLTSWTYDEIWVRTCFLIGGAGGVLSFLLKNHCRETPAFAALSQESLKTVVLFSFIKKRWQAIAGVVLILGLFNALYAYIFLFLPLVSAGEPPFRYFYTFMSLMVYGPGLVAAGFLADRLGISKVIRLGAALIALATVPACYFFHQMLPLQITLTLLACLIIGPIHSWALQQFEPQERCRGIFISAAVATSFFGGSTVPICLMIFENSGSLPLCALYPAALALLFLIYTEVNSKFRILKHVQYMLNAYQN